MLWRLQLAKDHGHHIVVGSRNEAAGAEVAAALVADGFAASSVQLDITSDTSIATAVAWIEHEFGVLDVLVNNAGILLDRESEGTEDDKRLSTRELFSQTLNTNVVGTACLTEACLPLLRKSDFARVIFVSSRMGSLTESTNKETPYYKADYRAYDCSKAAFNMLALNYARILDDIDASVNTVCPGLVQTKLTNFHPWGYVNGFGGTENCSIGDCCQGRSNSDVFGPRWYHPMVDTVYQCEKRD